MTFLSLCNFGYNNLILFLSRLKLTVLNQEPEKYYLIFEAWSLDPNQWSILIDSIAVLLAIFGVLLGFILYKKQRKDNSKEAYNFFQSSLPELKQSIVDAISDLKEFKKSLDLDNFVNPILSASLNDKFLNKVNLVHLNRYYLKYKKDELENFRQLLIDSNFFGDYHTYITTEINYFRNNYLKKEKDLNGTADTALVSVEMIEMKAKIRSVLEKDIAKFEKVLSNLNGLME